MPTAVAIARRLAALAATIALALAALLPAGCSRAADGIASRDVRFQNIHFRVVTLDLARVDLTLHWRNPATGQPFSSIQSLQAWGDARHQRLRFATNAGIYDAHGEPLGLYIEDGRAVKPLNTVHGNPSAGNFSLLPNGVFAVDAGGHASVQTTAAFAARQSHPRIATQSGPMLVIDGKLNPHFDAASDSAKWRSGVCAPSSERVTFAVSTSPVNFHVFASFFRDKLGCADALYLDGTLSQIYADGTYYGAPAFMVKPYAGIFAVFAPARDGAG